MGVAGLGAQTLDHEERCKKEHSYLYVGFTGRLPLWALTHPRSHLKSLSYLMCDLENVSQSAPKDIFEVTRARSQV